MLLVGLESLDISIIQESRGKRDVRLKISIPGIKTGCDSSSALV
jgi:hypothetical protein